MATMFLEKYINEILSAFDGIHEPNAKRLSASLDVVCLLRCIEGVAKIVIININSVMGERI